MSIRTSELPNLKGKVVTIQVNIDGDDEDYREITGKVLTATDKAVAIKLQRGPIEMVQVADILDIDIEPVSRRLVRRWLDEVPVEGVRQHLIDRHGLPMGTVQGLSPADAEKMHDASNHGLLGHEHGQKPVRNAGRPAQYVRPVD